MINHLFWRVFVVLFIFIVFSSWFSIVLGWKLRFILELIFLGMNVLNFCLEVYEFVLEGTESIFELSNFLTLFALLCCSLGNTIIVIIGIFLLNAIQLDYHLLLAMIFDQHTLILKHLLQLTITRQLLQGNFRRITMLTFLPTLSPGKIRYLFSWPFWLIFLSHPIFILMFIFLPI